MTKPNHVSVRNAVLRNGKATALSTSLAVIMLLLAAGILAYPGRFAEAQPPTVGVTHVYDLKVEPLVDYLLLPAGLDCSYGEGAASLTVTQTAANLTLSVHDDVANRIYNVVLITNEGNFSIGKMYVASNGTGTFSGSAKFVSAVAPTAAQALALYQIAVRLYYQGQVPAGCFSLDLVGLPFPVIIGGTDSSSTSSTSSVSTTSVGSTASTVSVVTSTHTDKTSSTSSTSSSTTTSTYTGSTVSANVSSQGHLNFKLVSLPTSLLLPSPLNYPFISGTANVTVSGNELHVSVAIAGSSANRYVVQLRANQDNITLGTLSTDSGGSGYLEADAHLDSGTYLIGFGVYLGVEATALTAASSLVAVSNPLAEPLVIGAGGSTTTTATTSSTTTTQPSSTTSTSIETTTQPPNNFTYFDLNLVSVANLPSAYARGSGTVDIDLSGGVMDVSVQLDRANPSTTYTVVLLLGSSNVTLGTFVTNHDGNGELDSQVPVSEGTYSTSVLVYDDSSFHSRTLVMSGGNGPVSITTSSTTVTQVQTQKPSIEVLGASTIAAAEANGTIPAEVQLSSTGQQLDIINHDFSVSVGRVSDTGVAITVSGENVTGPRTFLITINGSMAQRITSGSFEILFDGQQISEAASISAVLNPQPGAPATYAVVQTSGGVQLLVAVPHFSTHVIEILGVSFQSVQSFLEVSLPVLITATLFVTLVFGAIYASRRKA
ncbi:MAG: hypothetical protein OK456_08125 [Thaumarchaeota archaeon]|nr:hypothetical protein [Nitrososphaerota archaeon]